MKLVILTSIAFTFLITTTSMASEVGMMATSEFLEYANGSKEDRQTLKFYTQGFIDGLTWANGALVDDGRKRLYCQPSDSPLNAEASIEIIKSYALKYHFYKKTPFGLTLIQALQSKFPCGQVSK